MSKLLENKVITVFGGAGGSGRVITTELAHQGAIVYFSDMKKESVESLCQTLTDEGCTVKGFVCNTLNEDEVKAVVDAAMNDYGRLDGGVNIVGTNTDFNDLTTVSTENFEKMCNINMRSTYFGMKYELPIMKAQGYGSVVNMGSAGGLVGQKLQGAYNATKYGVIGMTKAAALDFAPYGVSINTVCPGPMRTDGMQYMLDQDPHFADQYLVDVPIGRFVEMQEVANAFAFLLSDKASGITGVALPVDGGMTAD